MIRFPAFSFKRLGLLAVLLLTPVFLQAQDRTPAQPSQRAADELAKLQAFVDSKDWSGALTLLNGILSFAQPASYDEAIAKDIISKIELQEGHYTQAIDPTERAYNLGETYKYFDARSQLDRLNYLVQLYYQEASSSKVPAVQRENYKKAQDYIEIWFAHSTKPTEEMRMLYATLLYNQAVMDSAHIDKDLLVQCEKQVKEGLLTSIHPKENLYVIYLAALQQMGELQKTADILELLVKQYPSKKTYWEQLMSTYANLGAEAKTPELSRQFNIRAIVTIERAQALGFMNTPKDNYNLVGIYFNIAQFGKATALLYQGLHDGTIDSDTKKWELLAYSYQQINQDFKAIDVLKEADEKFPATGQFDNQIAQIYYSLNNVDNAYTYLNQAIAKDHLEKAGSVYYFLAYVCFELRKFDEALVAINKAAEYPESRDTQLPSLRQAIKDAIKEHDAGVAAKNT